VASGIATVVVAGELEGAALWVPESGAKAPSDEVETDVEVELAA
jgi:hypothetical protein